MAKARKSISVAKLLGGLSKEQLNELNEAYNGGLGSGKSPQQWKQEREKKAAASKKKSK